MKITEKTLDLLESFSSINDQIIIGSKELVAKPENKDIVGRFVLPKGGIEIDGDMGIVIKEFLSILGLFEDGFKLDENVDTNEINIIGKSQKTLYTTLYTKTLPTYTMGAEEAFDEAEDTITFTLDGELIEKLNKHRSVLGADEVLLKGEKGKASLVLRNSTTKSQSEIKLNGAKASEDLEAYLSNPGMVAFFTVLFEGVYQVSSRLTEIEGMDYLITKIQHTELNNKKDGNLYYFIVTSL